MLKSDFHPLFVAALGLATTLLACTLGGGPPHLSAYLAANQSQLTRPVSVDDRPIRFVVEPGTPARAVGQQLQESGIINDDLLF